MARSLTPVKLPKSIVAKNHRPKRNLARDRSPGTVSLSISRQPTKKRRPAHQNLAAGAPETSAPFSRRLFTMETFYAVELILRTAWVSLTGPNGDPYNSP